MARQSHPRQDSTKNPRVKHEQKLRVLSHAGVVVDPTNKRATTRAYRNFLYTRDMARPVSKTAAAEFKKHGFHVVGKSVIVDSPRDKKRRKIKGVTIRALSGGVVTTRVKSRRDYIYGFTRKEKKEFAKNPDLITKAILKRLKERFPTLKKARKVQERLQWGSYQATKDFAPSYFTARYFATISPEEKRRPGPKSRKQPRIDKLTGLHFVVHVVTTPSTARKRRKSHVNKSKKKR